MSNTILYVIETAQFASDVAGYLMAPDGEVLHSHMSSSPSWLRRDLTQSFGRAEELAARFPDHTIQYVSAFEPIPDAIAKHFERDAAEATS